MLRLTSLNYIFSGNDLSLLSAGFLRFLMTTWMLFALIVYATYAGNLISMLAVPDTSLPINVSYLQAVPDSSLPINVSYLHASRA